jgi:hypothetical protein
MQCNSKEQSVIWEHIGIVCSFSTTTNTTTNTITTTTSKAFPIGQKYYHSYAVVIHT